jgi:hypothetical protein
MREHVLLLPGWQNSGPAHWQSLWEAKYGYTRVQQHDWMHPLRGDWIVQLEEYVLARSEPVVLAAHSLGCLLVAAWATCSRNTHKVRAALLVAPGDVEREELQPVLKSWSPVTHARLSFPATLLASHNDPYCSFERAQFFADQWGTHCIDYGMAGHINADSGLGDWPQGHALITQLLETKDSRHGN